MIEAYKIGISIAMSSNASAILGVLGKDLFGLGEKAKALTGELNAAKIAAVGAMGIIAGTGALVVMGKLVDKAIEYNQQLAQMKMANYSPQDQRMLDEQAKRTMMEVPGSNLTTNLKTLIDLRNISGSAEHAVELADIVTKTNLVLENVAKGQGKSTAGDEGYLFMKFLEDSGRTMDPKTGQFSMERVTEQMQWMQAVISAMNARVTGADLFQLRQSGKASVNTLSDQGLTNLLPAIQSLGPVAVGTALQGAQQQLLGAVQLRQQTVDWLAEYHMIDMKKAHKGKGGFFKLDPGAITGEQTMMHDLAGWIWGTLEPAMAAKGLSKEQMTDEVKRSGLRTPLLGLIAELLQNETVQKKEIGNVQRAGAVNQYDVMNKESPTFQVTKFTEAWDNLMKALGMPIVKTATDALGWLTDKLNLLGAWALKNPDTVKEIEILTAKLAGFAIVVGTMALVGGTLSAIASGLSALASVTGLATLGTSIGLVGVGLNALVAPITALLGILTLGSFFEPRTDADKKAREEAVHPQVQGREASPTNMPTLDGHYDSKGRWVQGVPPIPGPPIPLKGEQHSENTTIINLDGRKIAEVVTKHLSRPMPNGGPTNADPRNTPYMPGVAYG